VSRYFVICREDNKPDGSKGKYVLARQQTTQSVELAREYAKTLHPAREPIILMEVK
jgi:hypothetical protein